MRLWAMGYDIFNDPVMGDLTETTVLPSGSVRHAATLGGWPLAVRAASTDVKTAVARIREITAAAAQRERAMARHPYLPALRALYDEPAIQQRMPLYQEILPFVDAGGLAIRPAKVAGARYPQVSSAYATAVASVLYAGVDAAAALAELEQTLVALLRGDA